MEQRAQKLHNWLAKELNTADIGLQDLAGDASSRHYYRIQHQGKSHVVMDSPPEREKNDSFIEIANILQGLGLQVPQILATDLDNGFLLLSDLGDNVYVREINKDNANVLYDKAFHCLLKMQNCEPEMARQLPCFDKDFVMMELERFQDWFLQRDMGLSLSDSELEMLDCVYDRLVTNALEQPTVFVHRDFHSRNLIRLDNGDVGFIDFQDAVWGPLTYDLVSLLRDVSVSWSVEQVENWLFQYYDIASNAGKVDCSIRQFKTWFDWMGLQLHLKIMGVFSRLKLRDNKLGYMKYMPNAVRYALEVTKSYGEFSDLYRFLLNKVAPQIL